MSDDDKKKSKARLLADSINEAHPARANHEYAKRLERNIAAQTEQLNALRGNLAIVQQQAAENQEAALEHRRQILQNLEEIAQEIWGIEAMMEVVVPDGLWMSYADIHDPDAAMDTQVARDWQDALSGDEVVEKETYEAAARLGELYEIRSQMSMGLAAAENRTTEGDHRDTEEILTAKQMVEDCERGLKQLIEMRKEEDERAAFLRDREKQVALLREETARLMQQEANSALDVQRRAIAAEKAPPTQADNDRRIKEMQDAFDQAQQKATAKEQEQKGQLDRIENLLGTVLNQLNATQEENKRLKEQVEHQNSASSGTTEAVTGETKEASATVQVSFGVSAKAEVGKAKVQTDTQQPRSFDDKANTEYWSDPNLRDTEWRIRLMDWDWKSRQAIMIRSGIDLFEENLLKIRLMSYFRYNAWRCEFLNTNTGQSAILALGHAKFRTPRGDFVFIKTCLDDDNSWKATEDEVMDDLNLDKQRKLQKHECFEVRREVLRRLGRAA